MVCRNDAANRGSGRLLAGFCLALASTVFTLTLLEEVLRGIGIDHLPGVWANEIGTGYLDAGDGIYRFDPALNMERMRPHYDRDMFFNEYHWHHSGDWMGFRNPTDRRCVDIALIGDSMVYGHALEEPQTIRSDLEALVHRPVANLGQQAAAMDYEYEILRHDAARLDPDYVFVFFLNNDINDLETRLSEGEMQRFLALPVEDHDTRYFEIKPRRSFWQAGGMLRNLYVMRSVLMFKHMVQAWSAHFEEWRRRHGGGVEVEAAPDAPADMTARGLASAGSDQPTWMNEPPFAGDRLKQLAMEFHLRAILKAYDFASRHQMRMVYVFIAVPQPHDELFEQIIGDYCRANRIDFFSLRPVLQHAQGQGVDIFLPRDGHFSAQGAAVTAQALEQRFNLRATAGRPPSLSRAGRGLAPSACRRPARCTGCLGRMMDHAAPSNQKRESMRWLDRFQRGLQAVINGYQFETLDLLSSQHEGREMKCIQRSQWLRGGNLASHLAHRRA
jgi:hypothetical protein